VDLADSLSSSEEERAGERRLFEIGIIPTVGGVPKFWSRAVLTAMLSAP